MKRELKRAQHASYSETSAVPIELTKDQFMGVIMGSVDLADAIGKGQIKLTGDAIGKGQIKLTGDASAIAKFFGSFDQPTDSPVLTVR